MKKAVPPHSPSIVVEPAEKTVKIYEDCSNVITCKSPESHHRQHFSTHIVFWATGILSTLWFLIRVVPKPSRASYPCMRAAAPFMSTFIVYLLGVATSVFALRKSRGNFLRAKYWSAGVFLCIGVAAAMISFSSDSPPVYANSTSLLSPNQPIGTPRGIYPGRVVWVWDSSATNERCTNTFGDGWFQNNNTDTNIVQTMVDDAVERLTGKTSVSGSWDALFKYFNQNHGKGSVGYAPNEKIFIRTNQVSASDGTYDTATYAIKNQSRYGMAETSPQVVLALLKELVNECGIPQENISIGDPMKHMYKHVYDLWHNDFPNVIYIDSRGTHGRTKPVAESHPSIYYSDRGTILKENGTTGNPVTSDYFPTVIMQADYLITIPAMKAHARGGVTLCGKIHFGSNLAGSATHLHGGLIAPNMMYDTASWRAGYGLFRVQVDLMGHKDLGGKTLLFLVDALWAGSEANDPPRKFFMPPFNSDWTSSVFLSQDQVAIESVCYDFLKAEYTSNNPYGSYPQMEGSDDYILQAADSSYWPSTIRYDPEDDGTRLGSLGVCEHWNNPVDKQYTRNLGTGDGIELVFINKSLTGVRRMVSANPSSFRLFQNYPNPFNPTTQIRYTLQARCYVSVRVFDLTGSEVAVLVDETQDRGEHTLQWKATGLSSGVYFCNLFTGGLSETRKMVLQK